MQIKNILCCFLLICTAIVVAQPKGDIYRVVFISNLDDIDKYDNSIKLFIEQINAIEEPFSLVLNGDFSEDIQLTHAKTLAHYISNRPECRLIITQGDRDWDDSGKQGLKKILEVEHQIKSLNYANVLWMNPEGCPGPNIITLDNHLQLIGINTQWFNHPHLKPTGDIGPCRAASTEEFFNELEHLLDLHADQNLLIVGHMPILSNGPYGGKFPTTDWILPVPLIAGFITAHKQNVGGSKEICNRQYEPFAKKLSNVLLDRKSLIYASGHDEHTEILSHGDNYLINNGGISNANYVRGSRFTEMKQKTPGYVELIYVPDGEVRSKFRSYDEEIGFQLVDERVLLQAPCEDPIPNILMNQRVVPCVLDLPVLDKMTFEHPDSVLIKPKSDEKTSKIGRFFLGEHYRDAWTEEVAISVLDLDTANGGLIPYFEGPGSQVKSLFFKGQDGKEYIFRSLNKTSKIEFNIDLRQTIISVLLQDQTTTQHPYAALIASDFLENEKLLHTAPKLVVLPDDPKLGSWRKKFGGVAGYLEEYPTKYTKRKYSDAHDIERTGNMIRSLLKNPENHVNRAEYFKARLLDIYLGDWNRGEKNWTWVSREHFDHQDFRPLPRIRDHMFSKWDGLLPWLADREWALRSIENFNHKIKDVRSLTYNARYLDRFLLNNLNAMEVDSIASIVQNNIDDLLIDQALNNIPKDLDITYKGEIKNKLVSRRNKLSEYAREFYLDMAKEVDVVGSEKRDYFYVYRQENGSVTVQVQQYGMSKFSEAGFNRTFDPRETKEIRLFGLSGDDVFYIDGKVDESILVRLIPGAGIDSFVDHGEVESRKRYTILYENELSKDLVFSKQDVIFERRADVQAYDYQRTAYQYNRYSLLPYVFYNSDRGVVFGNRVNFTNYQYGFKKFKSKHRLSARVSTNGNLALLFEPRWNGCIGNVDLIGRVEYDKNQNFNYYFGRGNFEEYNVDLLKDKYYTLRYTSTGLAFGLSTEFWKYSEVRLLFASYYNTEQRRSGTIADEDLDIIGLEGGFNTQAELTIDLDLRDRNDLPRTGYRWFSEAFLGTELLNEGGSYISARSHIEVFKTFYPFTLGCRIGGLLNFEDVPYFYMQYLGRNNYLRGYRQNRFLGDYAIFGNSELRIEIFKTRKTIVPMQGGIKLFADVGKLYSKIEGLEDSDIKVGFGGGIYFVPYKEQLNLNLAVAKSKEENLIFQFTVGRPF